MVGIPNHGTLRIGGALNVLLAASAMALTLKQPCNEKNVLFSEGLNGPAPFPQPAGKRKLLALLFATGLTSLGVEVVWIRQFTPYMGTAVYTFASILGLYLASTFIGSRIYRRQRDADRRSHPSCGTRTARRSPERCAAGT